jgi:hypothetical protein
MIWVTVLELCPTGAEAAQFKKRFSDGQSVVPTTRRQGYAHSLQFLTPFPVQPITDRFSIRSALPHAANQYSKISWHQQVEMLCGYMSFLWLEQQKEEN